MIDSNGHARLADFGLLTIVSDSTNSTTTNSSSSAGTTRWMGPELFDPEKFGLKDNRRTKESDCYALAMVILEVLTGQVPFPRYDGFIVMRKVVDGERPERPQGPEAAWFTDDLWEMLERCWSPDPKLRPAVGAVLGRLEWSSTAWHPLPPSADDDFQLDDDHDSFSTMSHLSRASLNLYLILYLPTKLPANRTIPQVAFDFAAGVSGDNAASGEATNTGNDCDIDVDVDDELLRPVDGDMQSRPGQEMESGSYQDPYHFTPLMLYPELEYDGAIIDLDLDDQVDYNPTDYDGPANNQNPLFDLIYPGISAL